MNGRRIDFLRMIMKCTPIKLQQRCHRSAKESNRAIHKDVDQFFITKEWNGYTVKFVKKLLVAPKKPPHVAVNTLNFPENSKTYNTGYSLEKWSKKTPRLTSGKSMRKPTTTHLNQDYDDTCDVVNIIQKLEEESQSKVNEGDEYEISSDIEKLLRKAQESESSENKRKYKKKAKDDEQKSKKKIKHKLKKTIRFSFSKPASPETEQVIRVDVTSNISIEELKQIEIIKDDCSKGHLKMVSKVRKETGIFIEDQTEDGDFIIRCSQLAITSKKR